MTIPVDQIIFLLASDCFKETLLPTFPQQDVEEVTAIARALLDDMLDGGSNYYMCVSFNEARRERTQGALFQSLQSRGVGTNLQRRIALMIQATPAPNGAMINACDAIASIAGRLFWLEFDALHAPLTLELLDALAVVEPLGLQRELPCIDWGAAWLNSGSTWDSYIRSMMDGIDDAPVYVFQDVLAFTVRFDFLSLWKRHLGEERFAQIRSFIETEANLMLNDLCPDTTACIDLILAAI
ncbi:hypothetical protein WH218_09545 [Stenotrophomonas indicatrix]|uniref:hypothetical protein n=1 Tax=Stenotrophomonas indicatrix TaxID=2045451 RepID=UPI0013136AB2|nr:hypothetical protein [Stenotrophomonas indicatrix]MBA0099303.1 hypothetical protein [Stenotrophomonas indicatrix]